MQYQLVVWKSYLVFLQMYLKKSSPVFKRLERDKYFRMGSRSHSIPCRSPSNLKIHNMHPLCHSPCHKGSYSHLPSRPHSNSSRPPMCRCHRMLVPVQCYREWEIHRTSKPGYSEHSNLQVKYLAFEKMQSLFYSSCCRHCWQTRWTEFFCAFFLKQEMKVFCCLQMHAWPHCEFHFHYSGPHGHFVLCHFLPHPFPVLKHLAEASVEVVFWWGHHQCDFPRQTALVSLAVHFGYWKAVLCLYLLPQDFVGQFFLEGERSKRCFQSELALALQALEEEVLPLGTSASFLTESRRACAPLQQN